MVIHTFGLCYTIHRHNIISNLTVIQIESFKLLIERMDQNNCISIVRCLTDPFANTEEIKIEFKIKEMSLF